MMHRGCLAGVVVGDGVDVAVMGALNVSPESFYGGSVVRSADQLVRTAEAMVRSGAAIVDVGAMSTAPYLAARISEAEEADRLAAAVSALAAKIEAPISADTSRAGPARAALEAGARLINDVTGLAGDPELAHVVAAGRAGLIAMASEPPEPTCDAWTPGAAEPIEAVAALLGASLARAEAAGVARDAIAIDPGIGFFRRGPLAWYEWDVAVLAHLERLRTLGQPICVGVSRKSFIGALAGEVDPARRLPGSLAAATAAVLAGAHIIRAHDVAETVQAVRIAQAVRRAARPEVR